MTSEIVRTQADALALLKETADFYSADVSRRAVVMIVNYSELQSCHYATDDNRHCAVGRCMRYPRKIQREHATVRIAGVFDRIDSTEKFDRLFLKKYQGFPLWLWTQLQFLHDRKKNWGKGKGLSSEGEFEIERIKEWIQTRSEMPKS